MTLLVVDDYPEIGELIHEQMKQEGLNCATFYAESCEQALARVQAHQIDCVLLDQKLIGERGTVCLKELRERRFNGAIVILTGYMEEHVVSEAIRFGADDFLLKDHMRKDLKRVIEAAVVKRRRRIQETADLESRRQQLRESLDKAETHIRKAQFFLGDPEA